MPIHEENQSIDVVDEIFRRGDVASAHILALERKKVLGVWINPTLLNGWVWPGAPHTKYQYRLIFNDTFQDRGTITGGGTGTVAYIVPPPWRAIDGDIYWRGSKPGAGAAGAEFHMNYLTGEVFVTF